LSSSSKDLNARNREESVLDGHQFDLVTLKVAIDSVPDPIISFVWKLATDGSWNKYLCLGKSFLFCFGSLP
jgi:hypothetical protein